MEQKELELLCKAWTEYLQCSTCSENVRYFIREDGQLVYETEDEDFLETNEENLIKDITDTFDDYFRDKSWAWIKSEYIENVLRIDFDKQEHLWLAVSNLVEELGSPRRESYCLNKIKEEIYSAYDRTIYLLNTL